MAEHRTVRLAIGKDHFKTDIEVGPHTLLADEPQGVGGTDQGPDPYGLLLASLGACKAITVRMYADRKQWPLESLELALSHERIHAEDCDDCESTSGMVDRITCQITPHGPLDGEQRSRLVEIADKCPVHRTLSGEIRISTSLA